MALACGLEVDGGVCWIPGQTWQRMRFATSLDAGFGPGGPVEIAKAPPREWVFEMEWNPVRETAIVSVAKDYVGYLGEGEHANPARALCLAFLQAIEAQP